MKTISNPRTAAMSQYLLHASILVILTFFFTACGSFGLAPTPTPAPVQNYRMTQSTSTRIDLAHSVRIIPSIATLDLKTTRVTSVLQGNELDRLSDEQAKQTVVAKALATVNGDILLAPNFLPEYNTDRTLRSLTVTGYATKIASFRPMTLKDVPFADSLIRHQSIPEERIALNTMTVADVEYSPKATVTLTSLELAGQSVGSALALAKQNMLREEKADVLFAEQYTFTISNDVLTAFTLTAFPGRYANYRQTSLSELSALNPGTTPEVFYKKTIAADLKPVEKRVQLKFGTGNSNSKEEELKNTARAAALQMYNADVLLGETFYFDYQREFITHVTICGTPAVYTNFHILKDTEAVDLNLVPIAPLTPAVTDTPAEQATEQPAPQQQTGLSGLLNMFKKK